MKYKVGDKVRVRGDLKAGGIYGDDVFTGEMEKYKGKIAKIAKETCVGYELEDFMHNWTFEMLRPVEFKIWCETEEERQAVLEELEKEGYVWRSGTEPTEPTYLFNEKPYGLYIQNDKLGWSNSKQSFNANDMAELTPSEFTGIDFSEKIIITKTKTGATATYGDKTVTAEGDFEDAARQALAEVLCPFNVGDKVKTKKYDKVFEITDILFNGDVRVKRKGIEDLRFKARNLIPYTEPPYNAKLFCIKGSEAFTKGYIYEVKDGEFTDGYLTQCKPYKDLENVNETLYAQFMEVKGGLDE